MKVACDSEGLASSASLEQYGLVVADSRHLSDILRQIEQLANADETDEFGDLKATDYACKTAFHLLLDSAVLSARAQRQIPRGCTTPDAQGGI